MEQLQVVEMLCEMCNNNTPVSLKSLLNTLHDAQILNPGQNIEDLYENYERRMYSSRFTLDYYTTPYMRTVCATDYFMVAGRVVKADGNHRGLAFFLSRADLIKVCEGITTFCQSLDPIPVKISDEVYIIAVEVEAIGDIAAVDVETLPEDKLVNMDIEYCLTRREQVLNDRSTRIKEFLNGDW